MGQQWLALEIMRSTRSTGTGSYEQHELEAVKIKTVLTCSIPLLELLLDSLRMYLQTSWATIESNDGNFQFKGTWYQRTTLTTELGPHSNLGWLSSVLGNR